MAKRKAKKRISTLTIVMLVVALVGAALAVVGLFTDWTHQQGEALGGLIEGKTESMTLEDWAEMNDWENPPEYSLVMQLFAWIAGILTVAGFALVLVRLLINIGLIRLLGKIAGIGAILCGILAFVFTFLAADAFVGVDLGSIANVETTLSYGAYLLAAGSVVGGVGALVGSKKCRRQIEEKGAARRSSFLSELRKSVENVKAMCYNIVDRKSGKGG